MARSVSLSDLHNMAPRDRERALDDLVARAQEPSNGQRAVIVAKVRAYEQQYEMTTEELRAGLAEGRVRETRDFSRWIFWSNALAQE